jgi:hypothetical protein
LDGLDALDDDFPDLVYGRWPQHEDLAAPPGAFNPQASDLWRLLDEHFETFQQVYDERFAAKYGFWRPIVERSVTAFLKCGDLHEGFARVRIPRILVRRVPKTQGPCDLSETHR